MRKIFAAALLATSLLTFSCNPKDDKTNDKDGETVLTKDKLSDEETNESGQGSDIEKAAAGYCDCFNDNFGDIDPKIRRIIIKAGDSDDPLQVLQNELVKIDDAEEQQRLGQEMQKFSDSKAMDDCTKRIEKKYKFDENDKKLQRQMLTALEENEDCEIVAAFMRIGIKQQNTSTDRSTSDEE